jgi:hypothetical protein
MFVGLPDKIDIRPSSCLPMPPDIHGIPICAINLGAYATPNTNTLIPLFNQLF